MFRHKFDISRVLFGDRLRYRKIVKKPPTYLSDVLIGSSCDLSSLLYMNLFPGRTVIISRTLNDLSVALNVMLCLLFLVSTASICSLVLCRHAATVSMATSKSQLEQRTVVGIMDLKKASIDGNKGRMCADCINKCYCLLSLTI